MNILNWEAYNGDCIEIMKSLPDNSIDCIITDPPYWVTDAQWDTIIPFPVMWEQLNRLIKPMRHILLFWAEPFSSNLRISNIKKYKYDYYWIKNISTWFQITKYQPMRKVELISVFSDPWAIINHINKTIMKKIKHKKASRGGELLGYINWYTQTHSWFTNNILEYKGDHNNGRINPTQKPVDLLEFLIKTYTDEGETVLDFTSWSFSCAVACENTKRKWIWIEKDEKQFKLWIERIIESQNQKRLYI